MRRLAICAAAAALGLSARAYAGGFEIYDASPTASGMADAVSAKADDASAIFYNPAGIALHPGGGVMLGATLVFTSFSNTSPDGTRTETNSPSHILPDVYASTHLGERAAVGIGLFPNFGAVVPWNATGTSTTGAAVPFPGRFLADNTQIQSFTINPTFAFKPYDFLSLAIGLDIVLSSVELEQAVHFADLEGKGHLGGSARGLGVNFGVLAVIVPERLTVGFAYRSAVDLDYDLKAHFDGPPELQANVFDQTASTSITLPHNFTGGLAITPMPHLTITTDLHYTMWSSFQDLAVSFPSGKTPGLAAHQGWHDSWSARVGAEYVALRALAIRIGIGYDLTPVPAETLNPSAPLADNLILAAGVGYTWRGFGAALAYIIGIGSERSSTHPDYRSTYSASLSAFSFALSYNWGKKTDQSGGASNLKSTP